MAKLSRRNKKRVSSKRRKATQKVKKLIKSVVLKNSETKHRDDYSTYASYANGTMRSTNLTFAIPRGDDNFSRDGDVIDITGFAVKAYIQHAINLQQVYMYFALVEHDLELSGQQVAVGSPGNYIRNFSTADPALWAMDMARCKKVYWTRRVKVTAQWSGTQEKAGVFTKFTRLRKKFRYNVASGHGQSGNLYLLTWFVHSSGSGFDLGSCKLDTRLYFKDL